jgi:hypothetical protein
MKNVERTDALRSASRIAGVGTPEAPQSKVSAISARAALPSVTSPGARLILGVGVGVGSGVAVGGGVAVAVGAGAGVCVTTWAGGDGGAGAGIRDAGSLQATASSKAINTGQVLIRLKVASDARKQAASDDVEGVGT